MPMDSRQVPQGQRKIMELLEDCGYNYPDIISWGVEGKHLVVLFTLPHKHRRQAMTAFISEAKTENGFPQVEVSVGFVAVMTVD